MTCKAWAIADGETGEVIASQNAENRLPFASTTKIMTSYIVLKLAEADPKILDEIVTFSERADKTRGSTAGVRAGEQLPVKELLYGLMLPSGNDASVALAEHFGERLHAQADEEASNSHDAETKTENICDPLALFVAHMNHTAETLGMNDTHYENPHGLTAKDHLSTAADLLKLARAAWQLPLFREYVSTRQRGCELKSKQGYLRRVVWKNTNRLLPIEGYNGVKTGTTSAAGACLVSSGIRGDDHLFIVVLGATSSHARYIDTRNLFRFAWLKRGHQGDK